MSVKFSDTLSRVGAGLVYRATEGMGQASELPALKNGYITVGTLTRAVRINHHHPVRISKPSSATAQQITIDGVAYNLSELTEATKQQLLKVRAADQELARIQVQTQFAQTARSARPWRHSGVHWSAGPISTPSCRTIDGRRAGAA